MSFLSPWLLVCGAALAVPLWLHLRRRRRQAPVVFPSLRHLRPAAARMRRQARVEDLGLLLLRLLAVALLAAAFARPVLRSGGGWWGTGRSVESVVVIDATASMGWRAAGGSRLEVAKRLAHEWVEGLNRSDAVALWVLTDRLEQPVPVPIADREHWFQQLEAVTPSDGSSSLAPVFSAASEWAAGRGPGRKEIVIISDNQPAAWDWPAERFFRNRWQRGLASLVVLTPDEQRADNLSVTDVEWHDRSVREGTLLSGVARITNHGAAAATDLLECRVGGRVLVRQAVELPANGKVEIPLALPVPAFEGPVLTGELALAGDALTGDDTWFFALPARRTQQSLVIERDGAATGGMRPGYFLTRALAAGGAGRAETVAAADWPKHATDALDSVWFTGGAIADEAAWAKALAYAEAGGTVVVTGDSQPEPLPGGWPVGAGPEINLPVGRIATRLLAPAHPLFDGVWSERLPFPPLPQRSARQCEPAPGARTLASLAGDLPLLVELPRGKGRVLWLNTSADRGWGDLPLSPAYVPLVQQLARSRELQQRAAANAWVGEGFPDLSAFTAATWPGPRVTRHGLHEARDAEGNVRWRCAANVRRAESELRPVVAKQLQAMLPGRVASGAQGIRAWREEIQREVPVWPWFLAAAAVVFLAEGWMTARAATRRMTAAGVAFPAKPERRARA